MDRVFNVSHINIFRYLIVLGFSPKDSFEIAKADMIVDGIADLMAKIMKAYNEQDEEAKVRPSHRINRYVHYFYGANALNRIIYTEVPT